MMKRKPTKMRRKASATSFRSIANDPICMSLSRVLLPALYRWPHPFPLERMLHPRHAPDIILLRSVDVSVRILRKFHPQQGFHWIFLVVRKPWGPLSTGQKGAERIPTICVGVAGFPPGNPGRGAGNVIACVSIGVAGNDSYRRSRWLLHWLDNQGLQKRHEGNPCA